MKKKNKPFHWVPESLKWVFNIVESPQLYLFIFVLIIIVLIIFVFRLPNTDLLEFFKLFTSKVFGLFVFAVIEGFTIIAWRIDRQNLKNEIQRLSTEKSKYMHANTKLSKHHSSGTDIMDPLGDKDANVQ